ncbi:MAG: DUF167 domain-containing protein [archaeon]
MKLNIKVADPVCVSRCHLGRRYTLECRPNSGRQEIQQSIDGSISKVFLKSQPKDNKANEELVKFLKKHFKKEVKIIKGFTSKRKLIEVKDGN